jgi:sugar lactone lactonase YvrE
MKRYEAVPCSVESYRLAEGPVWDAAAGRIIWVDINAGLVLEGTLTDGVLAESARHVFDGMVGAAVPAADGSLLVAAQDRLVILTHDGSRQDGPRVVEPGVQSRTNDGGTDPSGRFLIGTLALDDRFGAERLLRIEHDGEVTVIDDDLALSNGLAWSPDGSRLYSVDTRRNVIWERDYPPGREAPGARRRYLTVEPGHPDGVCMDTDGNLWVAIWGGGEVRCYAPGGEILANVRVPAPHTSSVAFVGEFLDTLLITTARTGLSPEQLEEFPDSGRLFMAHTEATGLPTVPWAGISASRAPRRDRGPARSASG